MSKNFCHKNTDLDYHKSLNRVIVLGFTGMIAIGLSMLIIESSKLNNSSNKPVPILLSKLSENSSKLSKFISLVNPTSL